MGLQSIRQVDYRTVTVTPSTELGSLKGLVRGFFYALLLPEKVATPWLEAKKLATEVIASSETLKFDLQALPKSFSLAVPAKLPGEEWDTLSWGLVVVVRVLTVDPSLDAKTTLLSLSCFHGFRGFSTAPKENPSA